MKTIHFKSVIKNQQEEPQVIEFKAPVYVFEEKGYQVFEFVEPSQGTQNRVELGEGIANIFAGPSTIMLNLNQAVQNEFSSESGPIFFESFMEGMSIEDNIVVLKYNLKQGEVLIGNFEITLTITTIEEE